MVLFDECKFILYIGDGREGYWRKNRSRRSAISATEKRFCYYVRVHQLHGVRNWVVFDGNLNQHSYINLMNGNFIESVE